MTHTPGRSGPTTVGLRFPAATERGEMVEITPGVIKHPSHGYYFSFGVLVRANSQLPVARRLAATQLEDLLRAAVRIASDADVLRSFHGRR